MQLVIQSTEGNKEILSTPWWENYSAVELALVKERLSRKMEYDLYFGRENKAEKVCSMWMIKWTHFQRGRECMCNQNLKYSITLRIARGRHEGKIKSIFSFREHEIKWQKMKYICKDNKLGWIKLFYTKMKRSQVGGTRLWAVLKFVPGKLKTNLWKCSGDIF